MTIEGWDTRAARQVTTSTYSYWNAYRQCPRSCYWRYHESLVPLQENENLRFGTLVHALLDIWHSTRDAIAVQEQLDTEYRDHRIELKAWHLATAMMRGYAIRYPHERFVSRMTEQRFSGSIVNPATGADSRSFLLAGKLDGIVEMDGFFWLMEYKTTSSIDADYLEKLWMDFQVILYSYAAKRYLGIPIAGVIYDILVKAKLQQSQEESEEDFAIRYAELCAKNKSGKSTATRSLGESDDEYQARLLEKYTDPTMFHREQLFFSQDQVNEVEQELWLLTQQMLSVRKHNWWIRNTQHCYYYNSPCAYLPLCRAKDWRMVAANDFQIKPPHSELLDDDTPATPVF